MDDNNNSILIAKLAGYILTQDVTAVDQIMHTPEKSLNQKLDTLLEMIQETPLRGDVNDNNDLISFNSDLLVQNYKVRYNTYTTALAFLQNTPQLNIDQQLLDKMQSLVQHYKTYITTTTVDKFVVDDLLNQIETTYGEIRNSKLNRFMKKLKTPARTDAVASTSFNSPSTVEPIASTSFQSPNYTNATNNATNFTNTFTEPMKQLYTLINKYKINPELINNIKNAEIKTIVTDMVNDAELSFDTIQMHRKTFNTLENEDTDLKLLFDLYKNQNAITFITNDEEEYQTDVESEDESIIAEGPFIANEQDIDNLTIDKLVDYIRKNNNNLQTNISTQQSIGDMRIFAKSLWRQKNLPKHTHKRGKRTFDEETVPNLQQPPNRQKSSSNEKRKRRISRKLSSEDEQNKDDDEDLIRRREEDKNFLHLKALELSKYAGVNERKEKIVQVTKAMQEMYDYCNCRSTINGPPTAVAFEKLLKHLNMYNLNHVDMNVNFYELLYPLTLYNDESSRIISYIFASANYFYNCAKNYEILRVEFNKYGPFAQIDSMVMFVIKFNFLCDLRTFFGQLDNIPTLAYPKPAIHNVLIMRDKIVKLAYNALQYNMVAKSEIRNDPKHLQRIIMLMNADFNII
ncbi:P87 [Epiphyas postvittana nucleopolyhedrovirus]|uniref:p87 n=1 Tax=Epiphyas postvittana nucleopolyhedrovirus TaxID=70600 RepID=Q91GG2_NPVEP|nr:P87 [Epiphyas postvittana nucleopolyhedrovirus]AAK85655.1 P87 [Epiphyas postvittana nucleopolyhedrovirus]